MGCDAIQPSSIVLSNVLSCFRFAYFNLIPSALDFRTILMFLKLIRCQETSEVCVFGVGGWWCCGWFCYKFNQYSSSPRPDRWRYQAYELGWVKDRCGGWGISGGTCDPWLPSIFGQNPLKENSLLEDKKKEEREKDKTPWFVLDIISQNHLDGAYNHLSCFFFHGFEIKYAKKTHK